MRIRIWIDGQIVAEEPFPPVSDGNAAAHSVGQMKVIVDADSEGKLWLIEVFDPSAPDQQPFRFGTDTERMDNPIELPEP